MSISSQIKEMVKGNQQVHFQFYRQGKQNEPKHRYLLQC